MIKTPNLLSFSDRLEKKVLKPRILSVTIIFYLISHFLINGLFPATISANDLTPDSILTAVNRERSLRNLLTLTQNSKLSLAAQFKADDMQSRHYFSHTDPEGHYIWDKIAAYGYTPYSQLGENLAIEFYDTSSLMQAWMQSPTHRANILNEGFRDQGMGFNLGNTAEGQYYSAIANTFGTLAIKKSVPAQKTPQPAPSINTLPKSGPKSSTPKTNLKITSKPTPATTPPINPSHIPLAVRGATEGSGYALPVQPSKAEAQKPTTTPLTPLMTPAHTQHPITANVLNQYLALGFGFLLLFFLGNDIVLFLQRGADHVDKKINNFVLLILSLIVITVLYWL